MSQSEPRIGNSANTAPKGYGHFLKHLALQIFIFYLLVIAAGWAWTISMMPNEFAGLGLVISLLLAHFLLIVLIPTYYYLYQKNRPFVNGIYASVVVITVGALFLLADNFLWLKGQV